MDKNTQKLLDTAQIKNTLEQEFSLTLAQRIERCLELKPHGIIAYSHFAAVSSETYNLYRDGHFYGTISLAQAVAEALVKFLCERNGWSPNENYEKNVKQLETRGKITHEQAKLFTKIWKGRNDYHHLNPSIEQDKKKLELQAKEKLESLGEIEADIFAYTVKEGKLIPKNPKYWDMKDNMISTYLRLG